ncbi:hypothetical protein B566_EDAN013540 [Ephemera danica]|nr:hypothetical protein B566_EDAN013540 [Ephemera danica]
MDPLNSTLDFDWHNFTDVLKFDQQGNRLPIFSFTECNLIREHNLTSFLEKLICFDHAPVLTHSRAVRAAVLLVLAVLSFFANIATVLSIFRSRKHRSSSVYSLILHLTIADLFVTIFCIAGEASWTYMVAWVIGNAACKIFKFVQMFGLYLSTFVLVLIGIDRFVAVRYPMKALASKYCNSMHGCE